MLSSSQHNKRHHSSLFSVFHRHKKRQKSTPVAPHNQSSQQLYKDAATTSRENPVNLKASLPPLVQRLPPQERSRNADKKKSEGLKTSKSQTLTKPPAKQKNKKESSTIKRGKGYSADAINELDPDFLIEALLTIGDDQPTVARSTPKHAVIPNNPKKAEERLRKDCIFEPAIYERMLDDSLLVCDLLTEHLNDCVRTVRVQSPLLGGKKGGAVNTGSFQEFLITATAPSTPSRSPATGHRSPLTISSASMSPLLMSSSPSPSFYRQKIVAEKAMQTPPKKDWIPVR